MSMTLIKRKEAPTGENSGLPQHSLIDSIKALMLVCAGVFIISMLCTKQSNEANKQPPSMGKVKVQNISEKG